jgi:hypothetical protein
MCIALWLGWEFPQAAAIVVGVVGGVGVGGSGGLDVDADGDAARGEEAIVPLADGGFDVLSVLGGVDIHGGADAVEVGFGVAPPRGLGAGIVVAGIGIVVGGRHGFGAQLAVDDLLVGGCRVVRQQVVGKGLPVVAPDVPASEHVGVGERVGGRVLGEGDGVYDVWLAVEERSWACLKVRSSSGADMVKLASKVGVVGATGSKGRSINYIPVGGCGGSTRVVSHLRVPPGRREDVGLGVRRGRHVVKVRGHDGMCVSGPRVWQARVQSRSRRRLATSTESAD